MELIALAIVALMSAMGLAQAALVIGYVWRLRGIGKADQPADPPHQPPTAVIMCVRGNDPSLTKAADALLTQEYPNYQVWFIFDNVADPGYEVIASVGKRHPKADVRISVLEKFPEQGSLKCHGVVHAIEQLGPEIEIVALVDADTIVHQTWLTELTAPMSNPKIGAATGIRWYEPETAEIGTLVRCIWNTAAIVQMYWYKIAWGGTLAIRNSILQEGRLLQRWKKSFCEDTLIEEEMKSLGLEVAVVPSLIMVNRERTTLKDCHSWIFRQLLTTRLYHRAWSLVASHGLATSIGLLLTTLAFLISIPTGRLFAVGMLAGLLFFYEAGSILMLGAINLSVRRIVKQAKRPLEKWGGESVILYCLALPITQMIYAAATLRALFAKQVDWRGVKYNIEKSGSVRMAEYKPYAESANEPPAEHSVS